MGWSRARSSVVDSGYRSAMSVQNSLVMYPIFAYGTEGAAQEYLPKLASGEFVGCFGLTEPDHGLRSRRHENPRGERAGLLIASTARKCGSPISPIADVAVVWAKTEDGVIRGFIVERGTKGFSTPKIDGKFSLRASVTGEIVLEDCLIPEANLLPNVKASPAPSAVLTGRAMAFRGARWAPPNSAGTPRANITIDRKQFGRPLAATQLIQKKARRHADRDLAGLVGLGCALAG